MSFLRAGCEHEASRQRRSPAAVGVCHHLLAPARGALGCLATLRGGLLPAQDSSRTHPSLPGQLLRGQEESQESLSGNSTVPTRLLGREDSIHHVQEPAGLSYIAEEAVAGGGAV